MKIKSFESIWLKDLVKDINGFIQDKHLVSVKYSADEGSYTAIVVYKKAGWWEKL